MIKQSRNEFNLIEADIVNELSPPFADLMNPDVVMIPVIYEEQRLPADFGTPYQ